MSQESVSTQDLLIEIEEYNAASEKLLEFSKQDILILPDNMNPQHQFVQGTTIPNPGFQQAVNAPLPPSPTVQQFAQGTTIPNPGFQQAVNAPLPPSPTVQQFAQGTTIPNPGFQQAVKAPLPPSPTVQQFAQGTTISNPVFQQAVNTPLPQFWTSEEISILHQHKLYFEKMIVIINKVEREGPQKLPKKPKRKLEQLFSEKSGKKKARKEITTPAELHQYLIGNFADVGTKISREAFVLHHSTSYDEMISQLNRGVRNIRRQKPKL